LHLINAEVIILVKVKVLGQNIAPSWALYHGDSCQVIKGIPDNSLHYSIFSPPFASLYTYSASSLDMGNCKDVGQFSEHFRFLASELHRVIMPGRLVSMHCMNLPSSKAHDGFIGIKDFRGDLIRLMQDAGFVYHSEVVIWKDPVIAMQRTKAIGLLHKQIVKDSAISRQGIPDYVCTFRKLGVNPEPVAGKFNEFVGEDAPVKTGDVTRTSIDIWQRYASPVWMDINPSDTLQYRSARENNDERHICPLQLTVIRRCLQLWTNPGDVVLDPFNGIGSTGFCCLEMDRRYIGFELKKSYYDAAVNNLKSASENQQQSLFDVMGIDA
jgi:predicted methyltransferase